jgi:hypothetical protein
VSANFLADLPSTLTPCSTPGLVNERHELTDYLADLHYPTTQRKSKVFTDESTTLAGLLKSRSDFPDCRFRLSA